MEELKKHTQYIIVPNPVRQGVMEGQDIEVYDLQEMGEKINEIIRFFNAKEK